MKWGTKNLEDGDDFDLYFVGDGDPKSLPSVGHDLAIFARCNHTIITNGMMSRWASVLSGGEYYTEYGPVVPHSVNDNIPKPEADDMTDLLGNLGGEGLEQFLDLKSDFENDVKIFWWEDIITYLKYDLYYWLTSSIGSLLPF